MSRKLRAGDFVEVRSQEEILATLDETGCLDHLPFMPEMLEFSGKRFKVSKRAHKTCDTVHQTGGRKLEAAVHLEDLRCDGAAHGDCKADCLLFWKDAWLRRVNSEDSNVVSANQNQSSALSTLLTASTTLSSDSDAMQYRCQATALFDATQLLPWWNVSQYIEDLSSGNTRLLGMLRVWFFHGLHKLMGLGVGYRLWRRIYDYFQLKIGGFRYPFRAGLVPPGSKTPVQSLDLQVGERVRIKSHDEILQTLDRQKTNRGMRFDEEMVAYCGQVFTVRGRVDKIIHETNGKMINIASPSVILDGVVCRSEMSRCRLFCPRAIPSYWREIWLERVDEPANPESRPPGSE